MHFSYPLGPFCGCKNSRKNPKQKQFQSRILRKIWCTFDAVLMHFWKVHQKCIKTASKVHQKCVKSASKVHQKCIKSASGFSQNFVLELSFWVFLEFLQSAAGPWQKTFMSKQTFDSSFINCSSFGERHCFFQERVSLQNGRQPSEHAAFLSWKCGFSSFHSKRRPAFNHTLSLSKIQIPTQHAVCDWHFALLPKRCNDQCALKHSWKKKNSIEGSCCLQVAICLIFPQINQKKKETWIYLKMIWKNNNLKKLPLKITLKVYLQRYLFFTI